MAPSGTPYAVTHHFVYNEGNNRWKKHIPMDSEELAKASFYEMSGRNTDPLYHARRYQYCVADHGTESTRCMMFKERWLELMMEQNGNKVAWNEEEVRKMIKEDAIKDGYIDGLVPKIFRACTKKCPVLYDSRNRMCEGLVKCYQECKEAAIVK